MCNTSLMQWSEIGITLYPTSSDTMNVRKVIRIRLIINVLILNVVNIKLILNINWLLK